MKAAVEAAETRTETTEGANVQNVITTTTYPNSWRLGSPHPAMIRTEATDGRKIGETVEMIGETVEMIGETVEMIVETAETTANAVIATRERTGASHGHNLSDHSKKRWTLIADSTCTRGTTENCAPITR
jgi:hypothetical protein